ncbi:MAG: sugar phosphate isomerase/epimerase [Armatimonadetes bacterium]|nr:sugar phosphate isomerase/epimerase [Armatimonadota bacterium]
MAKPISIQLYTVREMAKQDFPGTLKIIADIGYKGVEFAGLHGHDPKEIKKVIDDLGLQVSSSHTPLPTSENVSQICETELTLGNKRVISGLGPAEFETIDACKRAIDKFNRAAELVKAYDMTFGIHNHWWEFVTLNGKYAFDIIMGEAPEVFSELDVYWCAFGKADPVKIISQYKSRMPLLHIKDGLLKEGEHVHTAVGSGKLDFPAIIGAADPNVLDWLIVELDASYGDMLLDVKKSYEYLTSNGLAEGNR